MTKADARSCLYRDPVREHGFEPLRVEGKLQADTPRPLSPTGLAQSGSSGRRYSHRFESDGGVSAVRLGDGLAAGAHRVIQSAGLREERAAGRPLYGSVVPRPRRILNNLR